MADDYARRGQQDAGSSPSEYNALNFMIDRRLAELSTATVVRIVKAPYDQNGNPITPGAAVAIGYVDVLPLVNQVDGNGNPTPHQTVHRLSYHRYQGGHGAFISDPVAGDIGKMVVADRDTSQVRATGEQGNPGSGRRFDKADGTFFGCTSKGQPTQYFAFLEQGFKIADSHGNVITSGATGVTINGFLIKQNGDVVTQHGTDLDTHVHTGVTHGGDISGPPP